MGYSVRLTVAIAAAAALLAACAQVSVPASRSEMADGAHQAQDEVDTAAATVKRMQADPGMAWLLRLAAGVLVVPNYGKGAYFLGGQGGRGVLLLRAGASQWSQPAFYLLGGSTFSLQAGGEGEPVAMVLMTHGAIAGFLEHTSTWRLGANTGLTVVAFSDRQTVVRGRPSADIVMWSGATGLYGEMSAGPTYITSDVSIDDAYYRGLVTTRQILSSAVNNGHTAILREALAGAGSASYR